MAEKKDVAKELSKLPTVNKILLGLFLVISVIMIFQVLGEEPLGLAIGLGSLAIGLILVYFIVKKTGVAKIENKQETSPVAQVIGIVAMGMFLLTYVMELPEIIVDYKYVLVGIAILSFILGRKKGNS
jgi:hypothetical protein